MRRVRGKLVFVKNLNMKRDNVFLLILSRLDRDNSMRSKSIWLSRLVLNVRTT